MSVWNPETEEDLKGNNDDEIDDDENDVNNELVEKVTENVLDDDENDILNSSIWSSDNDDELLKTLEIEESNSKK
jgi:hypothetical protein